jgi:hypothetical protein
MPNARFIEIIRPLLLKGRFGGLRPVNVEILTECVEVYKPANEFLIEGAVWHYFS